MKAGLVFLSILAIVLTFNLLQENSNQQVPKFILTGACSDARVKVVNDSIAQCQSVGMDLSTNCIKNYLYSHSNQQKWDVISEVPDKCDAKQSFWAYNDCSIRYERYGTLKMTYTIWKATDSPSNEKKPSYFSNLIANLMKNIEPNQDCDPNRITAVTNSINYCQNADLNLEVVCIKNNLRTKLGEKWNAIASSSGKSVYSIRYEYFNGCYVKINNTGSRNRNYLIWKAQ